MTKYEVTVRETNYLIYEVEADDPDDLWDGFDGQLICVDHDQYELEIIDIEEVHDA